MLEYINLLDTQFNFRGKSMIEIGSYQGESTEQFAKLFGSIHAIDPWQNGYDPNDISSHVTDMVLVEQASKISKYIGGHDWGWTDVLESIKEFLKVETLEGQPIYVCRDSSWIINKQFV